MTTSIDLSRLPAPTVVEELSFEAILEDRKRSLIALYPEEERLAVAKVLQSESEPIVKLLEENAYRELLLRQRINDAARAVMLAKAEGSDLDQLGANSRVYRLLLDPGDPEAIPPVPPTFESDADFRRRIQLSPEGYTTAGSKQSYIYHALSAHPDVKDVDVTSPSPGLVVVHVLSRTGNGTAPETTLNGVSAALSADEKRPMNDNVQVLSASIVEYQIDAELTMFPGPDGEVVRDTAQAAVERYVEEQHAMQRDITLSGLYAHLHQPGVQNVALSNPSHDIVIYEGEAAFCTSIVITVAEETDV